MTSQSPLATDSKRAGDVNGNNEHRVLKFRPRTSTQPPFDPRDPIETHSSILRSEAEILAANEPDDFRHRMVSNLAALGFTAILIAFGIWLAISISDMRKTQDCVLMGRRDCARISTPAS